MEPDPNTIEQFKQITGADERTASFFLSAANNDCDAAVSAFFESDGMIPSIEETTPAIPSPTLPTPSDLPPLSNPSSNAPQPIPSGSNGGRATAPTTGGMGTIGGLSSNTGRNRPAGGNRAGSSSNRRIATLGSLERERDDDEKGYYAGGEKSGQMIQDPRKRNNANNQSIHTNNNNNNNNEDPRNNANNNAEENEGGLTEAILETARRRPRSEEERAEFEGTQRFTGAGYRLGDTQVNAPSRPTVIGRRNVTRVLTFYANGFRVDDGPLRPFDDPSNEAFLKNVKRGVIPKEMEQPGIGDVSITLVDKKGEEYVEERPSMVPFSGGGQRLDGGSASSSAAANTNESSINSNTNNNDNSTEYNLTVDEQRPVARIQVRLLDGSRLVARLNEDHTVGHLREFVRASRPDSGDFDIATSYPRKVLTDDSATIKDAQLNGATIVQNRKVPT